MGTKTISIDDEAYNRLKSLKEGKESFSDVVKKITPQSKPKSLLEFSGIWSLDAADMKLMKQRIRKLEQEFDDLLG